MTIENEAKMENKNIGPGDNGFRYGKTNLTNKDGRIANEKDLVERKRDEDLIIEENTIYEIDRDCYNRLKKQRKR